MTDTITGLPLAGFWRRLAGYIIDLIILSAAGAFVSLALGSSAYMPVSIILHAAYWIGFIGAVGATPGMRAVGERVVRADTRLAPTWTDAVVRFLGMLVAGLTLDIGYLWAAWDARKQGVHDHLAHVIVVLDR